MPRNAKPLSGFLKSLRELGAQKAKIIAPSSVETATWVRLKCQFGCGGYGSSLMCPPYSPTPEEMRRVLNSYQKAILFETSRGRTKKIAAQMERKLFLAGYEKTLGFGAGPCSLCPDCAFEKGCRHADRARPSMEACGIDVFTTARKHGFSIQVVKSYTDPQHYFGLLLIK